jgi:hypothetical protein
MQNLAHSILTGMDQDVERRVNCDLVLDEARQLRAGAGLGVGNEAGRVMLHQAVQRAPLRSMALVVDRGAIRRPLWLPAGRLHDGLPKW